MSQKQKLIDKFLGKPKSIKYRDLIIILEYFGFIKIPAKGSHVKYSHSQIDYDLIIPIHNNECKDFYKEQAKKYIQQIIKKHEKGSLHPDDSK